VKRYPLLAACAVAALAVTGCGGGGSSVTPTGITNTQSQLSKATMHITIPSRSSGTSAGKRGAQYISPSTQSASFTVGSLAPQYADLSSTSSLCTGAQDSNGGDTTTRTCTVQINAYVGDGQTLVIKTFDGQSGAGNVLTNNTESLNVSATGTNSASYVLSGVLDHFTITLSPASIPTTEANDVVVSVTPYDAGNNVIIGTPVNADGSALDSNNLNLTASPSTGITIDPFDGDTGTFTAHYDGSVTTSPVTFTLALSGYTSATAPLTISGAPTPPPGISNGDFASGTLLNSSGFGWTSCSIAHAPLAGPVNPSPAPLGDPQAASTTAISPPITVAIGTPPPNLNPNFAGAAPDAVGTNVALTGDPGSETTGASGICQTFVVPAATPELTFWVYEGGSEYYFDSADQEADVLSADGSTLQQTLFAETNCFWDPGVLGQTGYLGSKCIPASYGGTASTFQWRGGLWTQRGPFDLSAYSGNTITLFLGVWSKSTHGSPSSPVTYGNFMFVGNVQLQATGSGSVNITGRSHR
jgi:hypothetical protein